MAIMNLYSHDVSPAIHVISTIIHQKGGVKKVLAVNSLQKVSISSKIAVVTLTIRVITVGFTGLIALD